MKLKPWSAISKLNFVVIERRTMRWHITIKYAQGKRLVARPPAKSLKQHTIIRLDQMCTRPGGATWRWRSQISDLSTIITRNIPSIVADVLHLPERFWTSSAQIIIAINWFESCIPAKIIYHCLRAKLFLFHVFVCLHTHNKKKMITNRTLNKASAHLTYLTTFIRIVSPAGARLNDLFNTNCDFHHAMIRCIGIYWRWFCAHHIWIGTDQSQ